MSNVGYYDQSYPPSLWEPPAPVLPAIGTINPATGVTATSITLTVNGTNLTADSVVKMGAAAWPTTFVSPTQVTATGTLPTAGTVPVTVTNSVGTSNSRNFTVTAT